MSRKSLKVVTNAYKRKGLRLACHYCELPLSPATDNITSDHIVPRSKGGRHWVKNLALACRSCNEDKADHVLPGVKSPLVGGNPVGVTRFYQQLRIAKLTD